MFVAILAIFGLSGTETGNTDVVDLIIGSNPSDNDFDDSESATGLFSSLLGATCDANTYNCADFAIQAEAQEVYKKCGGRDNDIHALDRDSDGKACVGLPQGD